MAEAGFKFQVLRKIAEGAVAEVFLARSANNNEQVVLKVLRPELTSDQAIVGRFLDEAKVCQQMNHPGVVKHLGAGRLPDGRIYQLTEYLDGEDLGMRIRTQGPLAPPELVKLMAPLCDALDYVHTRGVIHRDLKPDNVYLVGGLPAFAPKLIDFGLALFQGPKAVKTAAGVIVATPEYTPPECINGQKADARSDIYALGVLLFEALTGGPPFVASAYPELLLKHLNEPPPPLPKHAAYLGPVVNRCLAKNPGDRFASAGAVKRALQESAPEKMSNTVVSFDATVSGIRLGSEPQVIGGYQIIKQIGEGAMGRVYLAKHMKLGRQAALKVLRSEHAHNPQLVQRFIQEAQTVNQINHEHIVEIFDFIEEGDSKNRRVAFVMELLSGSPLSEQLRMGKVSISRIIRIARQACSALEAAHKVGVVHRDVKPDNIYVTERSGVADFVKVLDFGVAKLVRPLSDSPTVGTMEGVIIGTPAYMPPEQASGKPADWRADIYAMGVVLYEMLVGEPPFDGEVFGQLVVKIVTEAPPPIPDKTVSGEVIPKALKEVVMRCLAKEPADRPQSMAELAQSLEPFEGGKTAPAAMVAPSRPWGWMVAGAGVAVALAAGGWMYLGKAPPPPPPQIIVQAPPPAPAPPEKPKTVVLAVHTRPSGARVVRQDTHEELGVTPLEKTLPRSETPLTLHVELAGYVADERTIVLNSDKDEDFNMIQAKAAEVRRPGPTKKKDKVTRDGVVDPFAP